MDRFWLGYLAAVGSYMIVGFFIGTWSAITHLARFHGGGFQVKRILAHVLTATLAWPAMFLEE